MEYQTKLMTIKETFGVQATADDKPFGQNDKKKIENKKPNTMYKRIGRVIEKFASTRLGQMVLEKADRFLKIIEDTTKWSLPLDDCHVTLERPLPWLIFFGLIVSLRLVRLWLSLTFSLVGLKPVTPSHMINYIQNQRRNLRTMRIQGLKLIENEKTETMSVFNTNRNVTFMDNLRNFINSILYRPTQYEPEDDCQCATSNEIQSAAAERSAKRPRDDDDDDDNEDAEAEDDDCNNEDAEEENLTVSELLDKYANVNSDEDSDYIPKDEGNSSSTTSGMSSEEADLETDTIPYYREYEAVKVPKDNQSNEVKDMEMKTTMESDIKLSTENQLNGHSNLNANKEDDGKSNEMNKTNGHGDAEQSLDTLMAAALDAPQSVLNTTEILSNNMPVPQSDEIREKPTSSHQNNMAAPVKRSIPPPSASGSLQDIHAMYHPAPMKETADQVKISKPHQVAEHITNSGIAVDTKRKYFNHSTHHKHNHHNLKSHTKNRH